MLKIVKKITHTYMVNFQLIISGGHINLALSVGIASIGVFPWRKVPFYFMAQVAGGFVGAAVVYFVYQGKCYVKWILNV